MDKDITELKFDDDEFITLSAGISDSITSIKVNETNPFYASSNGVLYSKDFTKLLYFPSKNTTSEIHPNVTRIVSACFFGNYNNKSIVLPLNVSLARYAFVGVQNLTVDFNNSDSTKGEVVYESSINQ